MEPPVSSRASRNTITDCIGSIDAREEGSAPLTPHQRETAQYVADMILEMRNMAKAAQLYTVTVPLEFAYYEAFSAANRVEVPQQEIERLRELGRIATETDAIIRSGSVLDGD